MKNIKQKILLSIFFAFVLFSTSVLVGCNEPYNVTFGTYNYYGVRVVDNNTGEYKEESDEETTETVTAKINFVFNSDYTMSAITSKETYNLTYKVDSKGYVTFMGDDAYMLSLMVGKDFGNNGYFDGNKFYYRYGYNDNTKIERFSICVLETEFDDIA